MLQYFPVVWYRENILQWSKVFGCKFSRMMIRKKNVVPEIFLIPNWAGLGRGDPTASWTQAEQSKLLRSFKNLTESRSLSTLMIGRQVITKEEASKRAPTGTHRFISFSITMLRNHEIGIFSWVFCLFFTCTVALFIRYCPEITYINSVLIWWV